ILTGLLLGKPLGILLGVWVSKKIQNQETADNDDITWRQYTGASILAGIGFTMSIFITLLALKAPQDVLAAKTAIFAASLLAGILGYFILNKK
ncbi:MAG: Na+/H+ antiporter NhaA, partial [Saprospiraceae bacterium]|nr:Na+/H+ antiporter NhaA [Saprospiraceae bacterium]